MLCVSIYAYYFTFFFFNDPATTEIYTLSLHDALPICASSSSSTTSRTRAARTRPATASTRRRGTGTRASRRDRKSTRLNSSHVEISYAVFCLKKKKKNYSKYTYTTQDQTNTIH